jgi:hypothetical protein
LPSLAGPRRALPCRARPRPATTMLSHRQVLCFQST